MCSDRGRTNRTGTVDRHRHDAHERRQRKTHLPAAGSTQRPEKPAPAPFDGTEAARRPESRPVTGIRVGTGRVAFGELPGEQPRAVTGRHNAIPGSRMQRNHIHPQHVTALSTVDEHRAGHHVWTVHAEPMRDTRRSDHAGVVENLGSRDTEAGEEGVRVTPLVVEDPLLADRVDRHRGARLHAQHGPGLGSRQVPPPDRFRGGRQVVLSVHFSLAGLQRHYCATTEASGAAGGARDDKPGQGRQPSRTPGQDGSPSRSLALRTGHDAARASDSQ